jgi:hypothetical protein
MDENGYPTEQELDYIRNFDVVHNDWEELMRYIQDNCWNWGEHYFSKRGTEWIAVTGGWSGNEDVISVLKKNVMFWMLYWKQSNRGGKYVFQDVNEKVKQIKQEMLIKK